MKIHIIGTDDELDQVSAIMLQLRDENNEKIIYFDIKSEQRENFP